MMTNLFVSRDCVSMLERKGAVLREANHLTILPEQSVFLLVPAFHFLSTLSGGDRWRIAGKVLTQTELMRLGAHITPGRVSVGESTYEVLEGFVGEALSSDEHAPLRERAERGERISTEELNDSLEQASTIIERAIPTPSPAEPLPGPSAPPWAAQASVAAAPASPGSSPRARAQETAAATAVTTPAPPEAAAPSGEAPGPAPAADDEELLARYLLELS